jgi:biotin carboxyl carrier protein
MEGTNKVGRHRRRPHSQPQAPVCAGGRARGAHRGKQHTQKARHSGFMIVAAAGTLAATGATVAPSALSAEPDAHRLVIEPRASATGGIGGQVAHPPQLVGTIRMDSGELLRLARGQQVADERVAREQQAREAAAREAAARAAAEQAAAEQAAAEKAAAEKAAAEARRPRVVLPAVGRLTSGFGPRGGSMHNGIDIANSIGTPIVSAADGVVVEAGPASGFGLWVRVRHNDGTITVYGHVDRYIVRQGQAVRAGEQIATIGNRGQSTGPHLHFEVWNPSGTKINPLTWLRSNGVAI